MKRKPWSLVVLALMHILAPLGNLLFNSFRTGRSLSEQWHFWFDLLPKPLLAVYVGIPVLAAIFIFLCRRWSYWAYLGCISVVFISNFYSFSTSMDLKTFLTMIVVLSVDVLVVAYFVVPSVQQIYFDPRLRWWEAAPRYNFNHPGLANGVSAFFKHLSQGGLFMTEGPTLHENDPVEIFWNYQGKDIKVRGLVAYANPHSKMVGYGVRFQHTPETQKQVQTVIEDLQKKKLIVVQRLPGPEDSFGVWIKKLLINGEGLFPKINK